MKSKIILALEIILSISFVVVIIAFIFSPKPKETKITQVYFESDNKTLKTELSQQILRSNKIQIVHRTKEGSSDSILSVTVYSNELSNDSIHLLKAGLVSGIYDDNIIYTYEKP